MYSKADPETVQNMFSHIAEGYDRANAILSLGLHKRWNRALVSEATKKKDIELLDLCAGTGEIAFEFLRRNPKSKAILLDFCDKMLKIAQTKGKRFSNRFNTLLGDAQSLSLPAQSVDAITVAYGIRNVQNPLLCFQEAARVLKTGGTFGILELTRPQSFMLRLGHRLYLRTLLPLLGKLVTSNKEAYNYLSGSINTFSSPHELEALLYQAGFKTVRIKPLSLGVATLLIAEK